MADVKMCDRCGSLIIKEVHFSAITCSDGTERFLGTVGNKHYDFDLCQNCLNSLTDWFKNGKQQG